MILVFVCVNMMVEIDGGYVWGAKHKCLRGVEVMVHAMPPRKEETLINILCSAVATSSCLSGHYF